MNIHGLWHTYYCCLSEAAINHVLILHATPRTSSKMQMGNMENVKNQEKKKLKSVSAEVGVPGSVSY